MHITPLRDVFHDRLRTPADPGYDTARLVWRRDVDPHPAVIAEAGDPKEVRTALFFAREHDLPFAVQATGHGTVAPCDGGLVLKTGTMASVEVDPERRIARVGAGAVWGDVVTAAAPYGLAPISGSSPTVGVIGYTLGGGAGWLSRKYGYAADHLLRTELVSADGDLLTVSPDEHPELFWALRGGGAGFGVVTSMELRLFPVAQVTAGMIMYGLERAPELLARYNEWAPDEPDESSTALIIMRTPGGPPMIALRAFYIGDAADAFSPLTEVAGEPLMGGLQQIPYADTTDQFGPPPPPATAATHLDLCHEIPEAAIATIADVIASGGPLMAAEIRHWGGAMARPADRPEHKAGPIGHRDVPFSVMLGAPYEGQEHAASARQAVRDAAATLRPYATGGSFLNFLGDPTRTATAYTAEDYRRLAAIKKAYDPDNFFRAGHNIPPAEG